MDARAPKPNRPKTYRKRNSNCDTTPVRAPWWSMWCPILVWCARCCACRKSSWVKMMRSDPVVEEMRAHGREFAAKHGNDLPRICEALRVLETVSDRKVVRREAKRLERKAAS